MEEVQLGPIKAVPESSLPYRKHSYSVQLTLDVVKGLSQCGLFLKSRKTLVERVIL